MVTYRKMPITTENVMKLGYKVIKGEIKTIILIFSVPKSQNPNEEEKNSITAKAYLKIASCCGFLATVTFNNESPFLTLWLNFWTLYFIFCGS